MKKMEKDFVKVSCRIDTMAAEINQYFEEFNTVLEKLIKEQITPENLIMQVKEEINNSLSSCIARKLDEIVCNAIESNKELNYKINELANEVLKKSKK